MTRCIVVDDESLAQQVIVAHLKRISGYEVVAVCYNAIEAMEALRTQQVDLMFLDIQLPGITGLHFLASLKNPPLVILTTAFPEYAAESYEFNVIDYLLKPISFERFSRAIQKMTDGRIFNQEQDDFAKPGDHIFVKSGNKFFKVNLDEIIYVESMKDYLKIHGTEFTLLTHQTLVEMEKLLSAAQFIRVHKSYLVSIPHIRTIYGNSIEAGKATIPIGNLYKENVMSLVSKRKV